MPKPQPAAAGGRSVAFAKTTRPAMSTVVPRERLFARLDGAAGRAVAWISGPPGCGKTSLAASYVEARRLRCLWYQVDPDDADVATFFHYLGHAARKLDADRAKDLPAWGPDFAGDPASFGRRYFRKLFSLSKAPLALVLDNLHAVPQGSPLHAVLDGALAQVPKGSCVIVTSRLDSPASLARLRVTGEMACVGGELLRVDAAELAQIAQLRGQALPGDSAAQLLMRTQGWAAGLVLMLEHAKLAGRVAELPGDSTPEVIFDYLAGEIFARFEPKMREFLLRIACLPHITADIAQQLSGEEKASRLLLNLALNNYFVSEVQSEDGRGFQVHPLLRDFLRRRAARDLPEAASGAHIARAAELARAAGQVEDAVMLHLECRNWPEVARIARAEADAMLAQGRGDMLGAWLETLPPALLEADAPLLLAFARCRAHASPRNAKRHFEQAYEGFRRSGDMRGMAHSCAGVIDAILFEFDDLAPLDHWTTVLAALLNDMGGRPEGADPVLVGALLRGSLPRSAANPSVETWLKRAESPFAKAFAGTLRGDFASASAAIDSARGGTDPHSIALLSALHAMLRGAHSAALEAARGYLAAAEADGRHRYDGWVRAIAAAAALGAGDREGARSEVERIAAGGAVLRRGDRAILHFLQGWLFALEGDAVAAQREAKAAVALAEEAGLTWIECLARAALARMLADALDRRGAESQLRTAAALGEHLRSAWLEFALRLAEADSQLALHDEDGALEPLRAAFAIGREHGFQDAPWWRPREIAALCAVALRRSIDPEFARALVRARRLVPRVLPLQVREWPWPFRVVTLGRFELLRESAPVEISGKGPGRPMELLKVLVAHGGQGVRADQLADALWPHVDADYAHKSFTATLHRLRRLLGDDDAVLLRDGRLSLNPALIWVDTWALEQSLAALDEALRAPNPAPAALQALVDGALALYRGPFLPDESEQPAYIACREQLRARLLRCLARAARLWEEAGAFDAAADCYQRCIEADPLFEAPYRNLMLCYQRRGDRAEAGATYERLRAILSARLKMMPSPETQAAYAALA